MSDGWGSSKITLLEALLPQVRQFVRVRQALVRAEARDTTASALLDNPRIGVIHLDRRGGSSVAGGRLSDNNRVLSARDPDD